MTISDLQRLYDDALGRAVTAEDIKYWGGEAGLAKKDRYAVEETVRGSQEALRRKDPKSFATADRAEYEGNDKALKMYDLAVSIKGAAPTKGELDNWIRHGSVDAWEASLRGEIKWKNKRRTDGGTTTIKYYSKEALDRLGGDIGKGTNAGEMIATPTSYGAIKGDRWAHGYEQGGWTYRSALGSYKKGLVGKLFGEKVEKRAGNAMPLLDQGTTTIAFGESGVTHRRKILKNVLGSEGRAKTFESGESVVEDVVAGVIDAIVFRMPVITSARTVGKAQAASMMGQDVNWGDVLGDLALSWATAGVTKGLDKFATAAELGSAWTTYGRPLSQVAIGTAAGVARGQEFKDAFASSAVSVAAQQIIPKGANPWVAQAIKVGAPAAYQYSQAKGNDSAQMSAVASAIINYGAGVWQSSGQQKTGELVTSPSANAARAASKVTADETNKKLAAPPQARGMSHDVSGYFLAGGSAKARQDRIALSAQGRY
jgi:hypothetical protein